MTTLKQSSAKAALLVRNHPRALILITIMGTFTVSTPFPMIFHIPRPFLVALACSGYMYWSLKGKIAMKYVQFAIAYLLAFVPASLFHLQEMQVKWLSVLQLMPMLVTFCVLGSYFERWLTRNSDLVKKRRMEMVLLYFFVMALAGILFKSEFKSIENQIYGSRNGQLYSMLDAQRESSVYGGRPTALFSEPSNFAKFLSIFIAAYMTITKCSRRSLFALIAFFFLIRSVSYFYAAPLMIYAWWGSSRVRDAVHRRRAKPGGTRKLIMVAVAVVLIAGVAITQSSRISGAASGKDNSLLGRIVLPLQYMVSNSAQLITGYGLTPQDALANYAIMTYAMQAGSLDTLTPTMAATSTTVTILTGIGLIGLAVFYGLMFMMRRVEGIMILTVFLLSNIINAGYNSSTTFVLSALLVSLLSYQVSVRRARPVVVPPKPVVAPRRALSRRTAAAH